MPRALSDAAPDPHIHLVDGDSSFRTTAAKLLRLSGYDVSEHGSAETLIPRLQDIVRPAPPACVVADFHLPDRSGPELQEELRKAGLRLAMVFVASSCDIPLTVQVMRAGAIDVLAKPVSLSALLAAIDRAISATILWRAEENRLGAFRALLDTLTTRERQVFDFVVRGKLNKQTAHALGMTVRTVKAHRQRITEKMATHSVAELAVIAERLGAFGEEPHEIALVPPRSYCRREREQRYVLQERLLDQVVRWPAHPYGN